MVDQLDRDFELVSYNQHPFQLFIYEVIFLREYLTFLQLNNQRLAFETERAELAKAGQKSIEDEALEYAE